MAIAPATAPSQRISPLGSASVSDAIQLFRNNIRKGIREKRREAVSYGMVDGTYNRQWLLDQRSVERLISEGKSPTTINLTKQAIGSISGSLISDGYTATYTSEFGVSSHVGDIFQELYEADAEDFSYEDVINHAIRNGIVYRGTVALTKDYTKSELGRVALELIPPERIIYDPDWTTTDINHNRRIFTWAYLSAEEVDWNWGHNPKIKEAVSHRVAYDRARAGGATGDMVIPFDNSPEFRDEVDSTYLVINEYWLEEEPTKRLYDTVKCQFMDWVPEENRVGVAKKAKEQGIPVTLIRGSRRVEKMRVVCPSMSTAFAFDEGDYPLQLNGYHLCCWSADHIMGHPNTPVDQLGEINRKINKRESAIDSWLGTGATNQRYIEEGAAEKTELDRYMQQANVDGAIFKFKNGAASRHAFGNLPTATPPNNFHEASAKLWDYFKNGVSPAVPAMVGVSKAGDSGALYHATVAQAVISMVFSKGFLKAFMLRLHSMYLDAAQQVYTYPMTVNARAGVGVYYLNNEYLPNSIDMTKIPKVKVSITESPSSQTKRSAIIQEISSGMQYVADPMTKQAMSLVMFKMLPNLADADREAVLNIGTKSLKKMEIDLDLAIAQGQEQLKNVGKGTPPPPPGAKISLSLTGTDVKDPEVMAIAVANGFSEPKGGQAGPPAPGGAAAPTGPPAPGGSTPPTGPTPPSTPSPTGA